jgi:CheY-like chemotaxis protein
MPTPPTGRVLVVDDDEGVRVIFSRHLTAAGFDVVTVAGGAEGLRVLCHEENVSWVLIDLAVSM